MCSLCSSENKLDQNPSEEEETVVNRRRDHDDESEDFVRIAIEELSMVVVFYLKNGEDNHCNASDALCSTTRDRIPMKPFLSACKVFVQLLDKIGPTMVVLRQDMHQNIQRLETLIDSNPTLYSNLIEILKKEKIEGSAKKLTSCSKACLWLTRSLDFAVTLIQKLAKEPKENTRSAVEGSYNVTLKPWHGWISSAAYKVAIKIVPDNKTIVNLLNGKDQNNRVLKEDLQTLVSLILPFLEDIFAVLRLHGLDNLKST